MIEMKKTLFILSLLSMFFLSGCDSNSQVLSTAISPIKESGHTEQLHDYDSPYTICYKNKDGTYSMYIFASPIQYKTDSDEYAIIDNTVIDSSKMGFAFENKANNIKTYFPKTLSQLFKVEKGADYLEFKPDWDVNSFSEAKRIIFTNMYGDKVSAVIYESKEMDLAFYPTKTGIKIEIILKEKTDCKGFAFMVKSSAASCENKQNGYVLFKGGGENQSIIYGPLVKYTADNGTHFDVTTQMKINKDEDDYQVEMIINEDIIGNTKTRYPVKLDPSFEMYENKMPDSTVYSDHVVNNYLGNYAVVGKHPVLGEGWHYLRLRLNYILYTKDENIIYSAYYMKKFFSIPASNEIFMHQAKEQWSSTRLSWFDRVDSDDIISKIHNSEKGYCSFEITDFVQEWETESIGVLLKGAGSAYHILSTSDNTMYSPYIKLILSKMPRRFEPKNDINEPLF